jgi:NDP-sugar pyrophosphorylase family protein
MNIIYPAAGLGKRFKDEGIMTPKPLVLAKGVPLLLWAIANFPLTQDDNIFVVTLKRDSVPNYFKKYFPVYAKRINFIEIDELTKGPADTVLQVLSKVDASEPVIIANTDQYIFAEMESFLTRVRNKNNDGEIITMRATGNQWSYVTKNSNGFVSQVAEKKQISNEATVGVYAYSRASNLIWALDQMKKSEDTVNGEYYIAPSYNYLIKEGHKITTNFIGDNGTAIRCTGTPKDLSYFLEDKRISNCADIILSKKEF